MMKRFSGQQQSIIEDTILFTNYAFDESEDNRELAAPHTTSEGSTHSHSAPASMADLAIGVSSELELGCMAPASPFAVPHLRHTWCPPARGDGSSGGDHLPGAFLSHFEGVSALEGERVSTKGRRASSQAHDFNPMSRPNNPLSKVLVPFRMMKPLVPKSAPKAAAVWMSEPVAATKGLLNRFGPRTKREGSPPSGYVWLWRGSLLGWRRRFIVTSREAPGVFTIYKDNSLTEKVLSVSLNDATVEGDEQDARQLNHVSYTEGKIFIRAQRPGDLPPRLHPLLQPERNDWVACLHDSMLSSSQGVTQPTTPSECGDLVRASSNEQATIQGQDVHGDPVEASSTTPPVIAPDVCGHPVRGSFSILHGVQEGGDLVEAQFDDLSADPGGAAGSGGATWSIRTRSRTGLTLFDDLSAGPGGADGSGGANWSIHTGSGTGLTLFDDLSAGPGGADGSGGASWSIHTGSGTGLAGASYAAGGGVCTGAGASYAAGGGGGTGAGASYVVGGGGGIDGANERPTVNSKESFLSCVTCAETAHEDGFDVDDTLDYEVSHEGHMAVSCSSSSFSSCTLPSFTSSSAPVTPKEKASPADKLYKQYKKASPADELYKLLPVYTSFSSDKQYKRVPIHEYI